MKKSTILSLLVIFILIPLTLFMGAHLTGRWYYLTSTLIILEVMLPFFFSFESRKPQPRELVTIAVMAALAAVSRVAFAFIPQFKPITTIIMITGIAFGPQAGFLTGAVSAFASNFFFGQGPWTPWQMMAFGIGGFIAGAIFSSRANLRKDRKKFTAVLTVFGFLAVMLVVGPLLDLSTVFYSFSEINMAGIIAKFASGLVPNLTHAAACALTMLLFSKPLLEKLERLKTKYGMMQN